MTVLQKPRTLQQEVADMAEINYEKILLCLEQKSLIMKDIMNLTKRIEVEVRQDDFELDGLLADRQNRIERIIKCDKIISDELGELEGDAKMHLRELLAGKADVIDNDDELKMVQFVSSVKSYLERTQEIDKTAMATILEKREEARLALVDLNNERSVAE